MFYPEFVPSGESGLVQPPLMIFSVSVPPLRGWDGPITVALGPFLGVHISTKTLVLRRAGLFSSCHGAKLRGC